MRCYVCGTVATVLYPVAFGKLEITAYVCKDCLRTIESEKKGAEQ